jgi:hypothetical protein
MNHATRKPGEQYVIWMTRKMPKSVLERMHLLAAMNSIPLWRVHQLALMEGLKVIGRGKVVK